MEDAGQLRQKAERWRLLAFSLNNRDDRRRIEGFAAEMERQADALSGGDQDTARHGRTLTAGSPRT
jgi:hypothetical protein